MLEELGAEDAAAAAGLSARFGWPHRTADWALYLRLGRGVAWRQDGALAGTAMWFPLGTVHAAIGLVQVAPELQGRGIGRMLVQAVMAAAAARALVLHATAEGAGLYAALGFVAGGTVQQWQGEVAAADGATHARAATAQDRAGILLLDRAATRLNRTGVLDAWLAEGALAVTVLANRTVTGYAGRRLFGRGNLVGPVVAADVEDAGALVRFLTRPGFVRLDLTERAAPLQAGLQQSGLRCVGEVQRMTTGSWPAPNAPARCWALISQGLG